MTFATACPEMCATAYGIQRKIKVIDCNGRSGVLHAYLLKDDSKKADRAPYYVAKRQYTLDGRSCFGGRGSAPKIIDIVSVEDGGTWTRTALSAHPGTCWGTVDVCRPYLCDTVSCNVYRATHEHGCEANDDHRPYAFGMRCVKWHHRTRDTFRDEVQTFEADYRFYSTDREVLRRLTTDHWFDKRFHVLDIVDLDDPCRVPYVLTKEEQWRDCESSNVCCEPNW